MSELPRTLTLDVKAKGPVTADSFEDDPQLEILNPDAPVATLAEGGRLKLEATVGKGRGYVPADRNFDPEAPIGTTKTSGCTRVRGSSSMSAGERTTSPTGRRARYSRSQV